MGSTYIPGAEKQSLIDFVKSEVEFVGNGKSSEVIDYSIQGNVVYLAVKYCSDGKQEVYGAICETWTDAAGRGIKVTAECMGPYLYGCPKRIIGKLSPTADEYSLEWRKACLANVKKKVPAYGQKIQLAEPLKFTDGAVLSTFTVVKVNVSGKIKKAYQSAEGKYYKIPGLSKLDYKICA